MFKEYDVFFNLQYNRNKIEKTHTTENNLNISNKLNYGALIQYNMRQ